MVAESRSGDAALKDLIVRKELAILRSSHDLFLSSPLLIWIVLLASSIVRQETMLRARFLSGLGQLLGGTVAAAKVLELSSESVR